MNCAIQFSQAKFGRAFQHTEPLFDGWNRKKISMTMQFKRGEKWKLYLSDQIQVQELKETKIHVSFWTKSGN
jgi:hypothetical protein